MERKFNLKTFVSLIFLFSFHKLEKYFSRQFHCDNFSFFLPFVKFFFFITENIYFHINMQTIKMLLLLIPILCKKNYVINVSIFLLSYYFAHLRLLHQKNKAFFLYTMECMKDERNFEFTSLFTISPC